MADTQTLSDILTRLLQEKGGWAIELTGEWGVGKTCFWDKYIKNIRDSYQEEEQPKILDFACLNYNKLKTKQDKQKEKKLPKKYVYISLFGIDSLESLKYEMAIQTHSIYQEKDNLAGTKSFFSKVKDNLKLDDIQGSGLSISITKGLVDSLIKDSISDTLICIDDVERISDSLSVKDVMGLINYLKLEKNCKIVCILHDEKAEEGNKNTFNEYKEKVFDEFLYLDDTQDIVMDLFYADFEKEVVKKFYNTFDIKNIRFYQKVHKRYKHFFELLDANLSNESKTDILKLMLVFSIIILLPRNFSINISDLKYNLRNKLERAFDGIEVVENEKKLIEITKQFELDISFTDWQESILYFLQNYSLNKNIDKVLKKTLFQEKKLKLERDYKTQVWQEYYSLDLQPNYIERAYDLTLAYLNNERYGKLSFLCDIFEAMGRDDYAKELENKVKERIDNDYEINLGIEHLYPTGSKEWTKKKWYTYRME